MISKLSTSTGLYCMQLLSHPFYQERASNIAAFLDLLTGSSESISISNSIKPQKYNDTFKTNELYFLANAVTPGFHVSEKEPFVLCEALVSFFQVMCACVSTITLLKTAPPVVLVGAIKNKWDRNTISFISQFIQPSEKLQIVMMHGVFEKTLPSLTQAIVLWTFLVRVWYRIWISESFILRFNIVIYVNAGDGVALLRCCVCKLTFGWFLSR